MDITASKAEFYRRTRADGFPTAEWNYDVALEAYSIDNEFARRELALRRRDRIKLEEGVAAQALAQADTYQACADAANVVGDVAAGGAQRNLQKAYEAAGKGHLVKASIETFKAAGHVALEATVSKPMEALKLARLGLLPKAAQVAAPVGRWSTAQRVVHSLAHSPRVQSLKPLALRGWSNLKRYTPSTLKNLANQCVQAYPRFKPAKEFCAETFKWASAALKETRHPSLNRVG